MNPFDFSGPEFLVFYALLAFLVITALNFLRRNSETSDPPRIDMGDPYLIAYLRGGENEALRVALVSLIDRGLLVVEGSQVQRASNARTDSVRRPIERALLQTFASPREATTIYTDATVLASCTPYKETLKRAQLLPDESINQTRLLYFVAALVMLGTVGFLKIYIAVGRGRFNIGFLTMFMIIASVIAYRVLFPRLTESGKALLADVQNLYSGLKDRAFFLNPGGGTIEPVMLAAAFGVGALAGEGFAYTRTLFPRAHAQSSTSGGSSSCGSSCSSGGSSCGSSCGGGGCGGGCGGCGG